MTQKFSQSHFRIQTRSQRHSDGPRPRPCRLTKTLQPSSQGPTAAYQPHRAPDAARAWGSRECARDARQAPDRVCFFSLSGSNPRLTTYVRMPKQNRTGARPWGVTASVQSRDWRTFWSRHWKNNMHVRWHALCVKSSRLTIVHIPRLTIVHIKLFDTSQVR
jgi:hypothetical protein